LRVAALYDIHGMLAALEAVLEEVEREGVDAILLGGDVVGGPQPVETLARIDALEVPLVWIRGNGERALGADADAATRAGEALAFTRAAVTDARAERLAALPLTATLEVEGLGSVLFCHAIPGDDDVLVTAETPDEVLLRAAAGVEERTIVCGHTHMQYDRAVGGVRWINAGAVGMAYEGEVAAFWALLGPELEFRRTPFDVERAIAELGQTAWPDAPAFIDENLRQAVSREEATAQFEQLARERGER
jgi:predicted phosphodiesterase